MPLTTRFSDIFLYLVIGLGLVLGIVLWATYMPQGIGISFKWISLSLGTITLFGYVLYAYWHLRRSLGFWVLFFGFCLLHLSGFVYAVRHVGPVPPLWYGPIVAMEFVVIAGVIYLLLRASPRFGRR